MNFARRLLLAVLLGITLGELRLANAQEELAVPKIRRVYVPKDNPESWPPGNWTPLLPERLKELTESSPRGNEKQSAGWFRKAHYSAIFHEGILTEGRLNLEIEPDRQSSELPAQYAPWPEVNLAFSRVSWESQIAELGSLASGHSFLIIPSGAAQLQGDWSFTGRKLSSGHHFRLKLPPAAVSSMDIFVPSDRELVLPQKQPVRETFDSERQIRVYQIALGSSSEVEFLVISKPNGMAQMSARGLYTHAEASFVLSRDEFRFQQELVLESLGAPRSELSIPIPKGFEIRSVEWGGTAIESWVQTDSEPGSLKISLPSPLQGSSRPLRILGVGSFSPDREIVVPRLVPDESISLSEEVSLSVSPPLELKSIQHEGYRQVSASSGPDGSSILEFQRLDPRPSLGFRVGQPESRIQASLLTYLERRRGRFSAESHVMLRMSTGSTFHVSMLIAQGWEPVQVELISEADRSRASQASWQISESKQGRHQLEIDLSRSLSRGKPVELRISSRATSSDPVDIPLPLLQLDDSIRAEQRLLVSREIFLTKDFESLEEWTRTSASELPAEFAQTRSRKALDLQPDQFLLYYSDSHSESRLLIPEPKHEFEIHVIDRIQEQLDRVSEEAQIGIVIPEGSKSVSNLIMTCVGDTQDLKWELNDRPDIDLQVRSEVVVMADGRTQVELEFDPPIQNSATVVVRRELVSPIAASEDFEAILPYSAEADRFTGTISFQSEFAGTGLADLRVEAVGLSTKPLLNPEQQRELWSAEYKNETGRLKILALDSNAARPPDGIYLELNSILMGAEASQFLHRLDVHLPAGMEQLKFQFPVVEYSILANGVPVAPLLDQSGSTSSVNWKAPPSGSSIISFEYRSDAGRSWDSLSSSIPIPEIAADKTYFRWTVALPPGVHPAKFPPQVFSNSPQFEPLLTRRLFGPVGRNHREQFFDPRQQDKWTGIFSRQTEVGLESEDGFPADWSRYQFSSDRVPSELTASFWSESDQVPRAWGILIATVLVICLMRIRRYSVRLKIACSWFLLVGVMSLFAPPQFAIYSGALFCGSLISILIPRSLLLGQKYFELKSTEAQFPEGSTTSRAVVAGTLLICLSLVASNYAQEPSLESRPSPIIEILVPYKDTKNPSQSLPEFVYVREQDRSRLELTPQIERESILISSIDYHCRIPATGLVELQAVCQIHIPPGVSTSEVVIPIQGANLAATNACLVDGRPALISLTKDGFPLIDLRESDRDNTGNLIQTPLRAPGPDELVQQPQTRIVILNLYPPIDVTEHGTGFSLSVPRVPIGSVWCEYPPESSSRVQLLGARGEIAFDRPGVLSAILGEIDRYEIRIQPEIAVASRPRVQTKTQVYLTAQPAYIGYRYRISHRVLEGSLDFLAWELPPEFDLLRIRGDGILQHSIREESGGRKLLFDLEDPLTPDSEPLVIEGEFLSPARSLQEDETQVEIPELFPSLTGSVSSDEHAVEYVSEELLVGLSSPPELPLTIVEQQNDRLRVVDPKSFLPKWPEDARLQVPEFCFEAKAPARLKFLFTSIRPNREVSVDEQGLISDRTFDWTWTGEIRTSGSPVFEHRFRVDPRLEILSVSVKEDQAERDHQWFREGNQLTVRLGRKTEGLQTITIRGQMPLDPRGILTYPYFRLLQAEYLNSEFDVYRTSRWTVHSEEGEELPAEDSDQPYDARERILIGLYTNRENHELPSVLLTRKTPPIFAQNTVTLRKRSDRDFDLTAELQLANVSTEPLVLIVPKEWVPRLKIDMGMDGEKLPELEELDDGSVRATYVIEGSSQVLNVKSTLTPPAEDTTWRLSLPRFVGNIESSNRLLVRAADGWLPSNECVVSASDPGTALSKPSVLPPGYDEYSTNCDPLKLIRADHADSRAVPKIPFLLSYLTSSRNQPLSGRWFLLYEGRGPSELTLIVPREMTEFRCRLNGSDVPSEFDSKDHLLTIPFPSGMTTASIEIRWSTSGVAGRKLIQKLSIDSPTSVEVPIGQRELVLMTDPDRKLAMFDGMTVHSLTQTRFILLEQIATLLEGAINANEDVPPILPLLMSGLKDSILSEDRASLSDSQQEKLKKLNLKIPSDTSPLNRTLELGQFSLDYPALIAGSELPQTTGIYASLPEGDDAVSQTWLISRSWMAVIGTILAGLIAIPLLRFVFRSKTSEWLSLHHSISYLGLGLLWWLCLDFSLVGLLMASIALLSILWNFIRGDSNVAVRRV